MALVLLVLRIVLTLVFGVAGFAKLADLAGSRRALVEFGVPAQLAAPLGLLLPVAELAVALALLPARTAWWGGIGALVLLLGFIGGISINMLRGRTPDCHCFGQLHSLPVGWSTLVRNTVLAAIAAVVVWQGRVVAPIGAVPWLGHLTGAAYAGLLVTILLVSFSAIQSWVMVHLLRQNGRLLLRIEALETRTGGAPVPAEESATEGLPVGTPAPVFRLERVFGEMQTLDALRRPGKPVVLIFSDPNCGPCNTLLPEIARWQREHADKLTFASISRGPIDINRAKSTEHGLTHVLLQANFEIAETYGVNRTPSAVLINADGTIGSPVAAGADAIRNLVARSSGKSDLMRLMVVPRSDSTPKPAAPIGLPVGVASPEVRLPDLNGAVIDLALFRGSKTALLFWNPSCGFCQRMLDDLKALEAQPPRGAPQLLVVSTGTVEDNRALALRSTVVLDDGFTVGRRFGATGTPSAVLIDTEGKVASEVVVGAPAVLELVRSGKMMPQLVLR